MHSHIGGRELIRTIRLATMALTLTSCLALASEPLFEETEIFVGGQDDINTYRIPSVISYDGIVETYLKFAFARFNLEWLTDGKDSLRHDH